MATCYWTGAVSAVPNVAGNWSTAAVPQANDDVVFPATATVDCAGSGAENDLNANAVSSITIQDGCTITLGVAGDPLLFDVGGAGTKIINDFGSGDKYLSCVNTAQWNVYGGSTVHIDGLDNDELNLNASGTVIVVGPVYATPAEFDAIGAILAGEITLRSVTTQAAGSVPVNGMHGGTVHSESGLTTVYQYGGTLYSEAGGIVTYYGAGGTLYYKATTTITTLTVKSGGTADFSQDFRARTVTNASCDGGGSIADPYATVTWTNAIQVPLAALDAVTLNLGSNRKYTVADI